MATSNPPVKDVGITYKLALRDFAVPGSFKSSPTLAVGDVKVNTDGGGLANVGTLPTASGIEVTGVLTSGEMNGDHVWLQFIDQTSPKEWSDFGMWIPTTAYAQPSVDGSGRIDLGKWLGNAPNALQSGRVDSYIGAVAAGAIVAASFAANALDAVWSTTTRLLTAGTNIVLAKGTGITGFNDLDASGIRGAVGLGAANLDTQLAEIEGETDDIAAIKAITDQFVFTIANQVDSNALSGGGGLDAAGIRTAVGLATASLDAQFTALESDVTAISAADFAFAVWEEDMTAHTTDNTAGGDQNIIPQLPGAVWNSASENGENYGQTMRLIRASTLGESHDGAEHPKFKSADGGTDRITADVDITSGNRSNVVVDPN